eukprot:3005896-Rhodomonas_salina.3
MPGTWKPLFPFLLASPCLRLHHHHSCHVVTRGQGDGRITAEDIGYAGRVTPWSHPPRFLFSMNSPC